MSHGSLATQKARYRSRCTGIGHQESLAHLQSAVHVQEGQVPVPFGSRDQARLEAAVFGRLGATSDYCAHPAGVARLHPETGHLTVDVDPRLGPDHCLARHSLQALLPTRYTGPEPEGAAEPGGITGLRVLGIDERGLGLGLAGTDARLTHAGPSARKWRVALAAQRADGRTDDLRPLWDAPALTPFEAAHLARDTVWWKEQDDAAWVASGLLRRSALFRAVTTPYCVRYWQHGLGWRFELRYEHGVPVQHDEFLTHLTHPR